MKNRDKSGDAILTETAKEAFGTFLTLVDLRSLSNGIRNLQLRYACTNEDWDGWFIVLMPQLVFLFDFLDELEDEYGPE